MSQSRYVFLLELLNYLFVFMHLLVTLFLNGLYDMEATNHIVQDKAGFMEFHRYLMGSRTVLLSNGSEKDVLGVETYQLKLYRGNKLLLHNILYAPWLRRSLISFVS